MEHCGEDFRMLLSQITQQDKELRLKRRWLMDLHLSQREQKQMKKLTPYSDKTLPESLVREDDSHYENIRNFVANGFGALKGERTCRIASGRTLLFDSTENLRYIFSLLDGMNNKGLCCFAETVSNNSITFEKTNWQMKRIIRQFLPKILNNRDDCSQRLIKQISHLLKDPQNFRGNHKVVCSTSESFCNAAIYVLDRLEELPLLTLTKIHRDLRGVTGNIPQMRSKRVGSNIESLSKKIRTISMEMLSDCKKGDEPPEPLAKALSVAALMLKPEFDCPSQVVFQILPPDIEALQTKIAKAIRLLDKKNVSFAELKKLPLVLESSSKASIESVHLRIEVRKLLIQYLLECSDMESIPKSLLASLAIINKSSLLPSDKTFSKKEVEDEVECVLNISAQAKQIVWDLLVETDVSEDFANVYMENMEESYYEFGDNEDEHLSDLPRNCKPDPNDSGSQIESVGEINQSDCRSPTTASQNDGSCSFLSPKNKLSIKLESMHIDELDSVQSNWSVNSSSSFGSMEGAKRMGGKEDHLRSIRQQERTASRPSMSTRDQNGFSPHFSPNEGSDRDHVEQKEITVDLGCTPKLASTICPKEERDKLLHRQSRSKNQYLLIQEASDETSMVAYSLVGFMLNKFAQLDRLQLSEGDESYLHGNTSDPKIFKVTEDRGTSCDDAGNSIILHVLEEIIPSISNSDKEHLKELMGMR